MRKFEPTQAQRLEVARYASIMGTDEEIAFVIGISEQTLRKYFREELDFGRAKSKLGVKGKLRDQIDLGHVGAICFYLKTQCGWREQATPEEVARPVTINISSEPAPERYNIKSAEPITVNAE